MGVPEIRPELVVKTNPAGKAGVIDHDATGPPEFEGSTAVIAEFCVNANWVGL